MAEVHPHHIDGLLGWRHLRLGDVGSTNTECLEKARLGDEGQLWITAERQLAGKARRGRNWVSEPGNLYASLLLIDPAPFEKLATLPLVVSLALHEALIAARPELSDRLKIKWPNDLLLDGKKLSGILLEAVPDGQGRNAVIIGCGINCAHFPANPLYPATSLEQEGVILPPPELFQHLALQMAAKLRLWSGGAGFSIIRRDWLDRAVGIGQPVTARFSDHEISGRFVDLDADGLLILEREDGSLRQISAADIFFGYSDTKSA